MTAAEGDLLFCEGGASGDIEARAYTDRRRLRRAMAAATRRHEVAIGGLAAAADQAAVAAATSISQFSSGQREADSRIELG
jgi:hypothetical protein